MQPGPTKPRTYSVGAADQVCLHRRRLLRRIASRVPPVALNLVESKTIFDQKRLPLFDGNQTLEAHNRSHEKGERFSVPEIERARGISARVVSLEVFLGFSFLLAPL